MQNRSQFIKAVALVAGAPYTVCAGRNRAPETYYQPGNWLAHSKAQIAKKDPRYLAALQRLIAQADEALNAGPFTVMQKSTTPASGDKHDYMSQGPYWWPDPSQPDGLPYIWRDGEVNPETRTTASDQVRKSAMVKAVDSLALAYYFTEDERYANHAARLLRFWFLDPKTRMNPNLNFGQAIPGMDTGRSIGIIESVGFLKTADAAVLLQPSKAWKPVDHGGLKAWYREYLQWLLESPHGRKEGQATNNHGTWYDVQVACFALFCGDRATAKTVLEKAGQVRIASQIDEEGKQEEELRRTKSFSYSIMNLKALYALARLGESAGIDLWKLGEGDRPYLQAAFEFLAPYTNKDLEWPYRQISTVKSASMYPLISQAYINYRKPEYRDLLKHLSEEDLSQPELLLFPVP
ncbi:hypothetical protein PDESU_05261 [Pontiella desulfatans]|uniref:Alginate lyase domain-containing protein n=1 Tax=Pontiella desulfatans TaxID=2750659 RepID=A0A6C2U9E7_PONDE|nr:alginate lyase family protein [Pontiella desulfatans]VGO16670.1 hypothetical protein PDESU_05261 [Pontiella desulfatans]